MWLQSPVFMSSGLMLDDIIMNLFIDFTKKTTGSVKKDLFSKIQDNTIHLYKGSLQDYSYKKCWYKKTWSLHHFIEKHLRKYLSCILSIDNGESDMEKKTHQFINDIRDFNNKQIIQCNNKPISNIPE